MKGIITFLILVALILVGVLFYSTDNSEDNLSEGEVSNSQKKTSPHTSPSSSDNPQKAPLKNSQTSGTDEAEEKDPWQGFDKTKAREVMRDEDMPVGASSYTGPRPLSEEEMNKMDEIFEGYEKGWDNEMRSVLVTQMGLSEEDYGDYLKMRDGYEEDRLEAFESFHEKMAEERGPHYSYSPTQEMIEFDQKLKREYLDLFRKRYGEEAFARYQDALDKYNSKIRSEADPNYGILTIEF